MSSTYCNSSDLLHPHLMETSYIIEYLKHRQLAIPNLEQKSRDELLKIFHNYAMPLAKRSSSRNKGHADHQMDVAFVDHSPPAPNKPGNKHKRIVYDLSETQSIFDTSNSSKSMDSVTNGCKRIKIATNGNGISGHKRGPQDIKMDCHITQKPKRQKITWP